MNDLNLFPYTDTYRRPIHALIFLFRYKDVDQAAQEEGKECPPHIWFANQIPDFACATVALLNIVNNIKGLDLGKDLQKFHDFTKNMDPMSRGDAIDSFDFVRNIHNSFARETDLLVADMHMKDKANRAKKRQAIAKARETREAKKVGRTLLKEKSANSGTAPSRSSTRQQDTPQRSAVARSKESSPLSDPPDSDSDLDSSQRGQAANGKEASLRRSGRKPKPRKDVTITAPAIEEDNNEGFHFVAYMPIQDQVWKLDGLDSLPQAMGAFDVTADGDWINVAQPALQTRMAMYEGADIEFNLMAVVRDPVIGNRTELAQNIKRLQTIENALDSVLEDWRTLPEVDTSSDAINGISIELGISQTDIDAADDANETAAEIDPTQDIERLINLRKQIVAAQGPLRGAVRDAFDSSKRDDEDAKHMRHNYGGFVRSWLGALVENEVLADLLEVQ